MADIYKIYKTCGFCGGSGKESSSEGEITCRICEGEGCWEFGETSEPDPAPPTETLNIDKICEFCGGPGTIPPTDYTCPMCGGDGKYLWAEQVLQE